MREANLKSRQYRNTIKAAVNHRMEKERLESSKGLTVHESINEKFYNRKLSQNIFDEDAINAAIKDFSEK